MKRFMIVCSGPTPRIANATTQSTSAVLTEWQQITQGFGGALVDPGRVFVHGVELIDTGELDEFVPMNGYAICQAEDLNSAITLTRANPYLSRKNGSYSVMVFELLDDPSSITPDSLKTPSPIELDEAPQPTEPSPVANPGELTIPHESTPEEQPPIPPTLPTPQ